MVMAQPQTRITQEQLKWLSGYVGSLVGEYGANADALLQYAILLQERGYPLGDDRFLTAMEEAAKASAMGQTLPGAPPPVGAAAPVSRPPAAAAPAPAPAVGAAAPPQSGGGGGGWAGPMGAAALRGALGGFSPALGAVSPALGMASAGVAPALADRGFGPAPGGAMGGVDEMPRTLAELLGRTFSLQAVDPIYKMRYGPGTAAPAAGIGGFGPAPASTLGGGAAGANAFLQPGATGTTGGTGTTGARRESNGTPSQAELEAMARAAAVAAGVDPELFVRLIGAESSWSPRAVSSAGAKGLGQLMPSTARSLGLDPDSEDVFDPARNLQASARYLAAMVNFFKGDYWDALTAYNWGPGNVRDKGRAAAPAETQNYVRRIMGDTSPMPEPPDPGAPQTPVGGAPLRPTPALAGPASAAQQNGGPPAPLTAPGAGNLGVGMPKPPSRALKDIALGTMTPAEAKFYLPWEDVTNGGRSQAARNLLALMGVDTENGAPFASFLGDQAASLYDTAKLRRLLGNEATQGWEGAAGSNIADLLGSGRTSAFDDPRAALRQMVDITRAKRAGADLGPGHSALAGLLQDTAGRGEGDLTGPGDTMYSLFAPGFMPSMLRYLRQAILDRVQRMRQQGGTDMNPLERLAAGWM